MDLNDLIETPLEEMSEEDLMNLLRDMRQRRRTPVVQATTSKRKASAQRTKKVSAPITPEAAAELLKLLGVDDGTT